MLHNLSSVSAEVSLSLSLSLSLANLSSVSAESLLSLSLSLSSRFPMGRFEQDDLQSTTNILGQTHPDLKLLKLLLKSLQREKERKKRQI
jgi:hypothetical protein